MASGNVLKNWPVLSTSCHSEFNSAISCLDWSTDRQTCFQAVQKSIIGNASRNQLPKSGWMRVIKGSGNRPQEFQSLFKHSTHPPIQ